ncbi:MAG: ROK family transcriptional regulator [Chloroflexi bacterium]|nr:MAG: hypothetical protein CUN54_03330 [Phototrophicales bacterium]RMF78808.1 MAG: ROK family transcriptional regulator [Chloroflexota bacterium]
MMFFRDRLNGSSSSTIRSHNLSTILLALLWHENISRVQLAELTKLSPTTITNLVTHLLEDGIVEEGTSSAQPRRGAGRPRMALRIIPEARYTIGVHIGVGHVRVALTDLLAQPLTIRSFTHPVQQSPMGVLTQIADNVRKIIQQHNLEAERIIGIGVGASGLVDPYHGVNVFAPSLGWRDVAIRDDLQAIFEFPVVVDNNVRAMALGEALFGSNQDVNALAFVYGGQGIGAGFVLDGQLYRGAAAGAGEIGHTTVIADDGLQCHCGNRGCLETLVSEAAIVRMAKEIVARHDADCILPHYMTDDAPSQLESIFNAARDGDAATRNMLHECARYMGISLANLVNVFNPELIVMGGFFADGEDLLMPVIEATLRERAFANLGQQVHLATATFGANAGVVGAAALALNAFFYRQGDMIAG